MEEPSAAGCWRKVSILGSGGFGVVTLWQNPDTSEFIAVKKCRWEDPSRITERQRGRWTKEVEMMRSIRHDNVVAFRGLPRDLAAVLERYNPSRLPLLSMEYCTRGNLRRYLSQPHNVCGLSEIEVRYFLRDVSAAIAHLHSLNVTHRDVKPENVVLDACDSRPTGVVYKLIDLGYAKELDAEIASFVGTLQYLAPEIFARSAYGPNVDYWSFGVVVFEIVCGVHPFMPDVSPVQRYEYLKKKSPDDICVFRTEKGGVRYSPELKPEHHVNPWLKTELEKWLRIVLRFDPERRGLTDGGRDVFAELDATLRTNVVCVFSVHNYGYYHFDVADDTTFAELQRRLAEVSGVDVDEQLLLTDNVFYEEDGGRRLFDCMEDKSAVLVLFKKTSADPIADKTATLPPYVKHVLSALHESSPSKLRGYAAHCAHYVRLETKLMRSYRVALTAHSDYLAGLFRRESTAYDELLVDVRRALAEVEAHGERLASYGGVERMRESKRTLWRAREIVENVNAVTCRRARTVGREALLVAAANKLDAELGTVNPDEIYENALACLKKASSTLADVRKAVMDMLKRRYELLNNQRTVDYLAASFKALRELRRLMRWTGALRRQTADVVEALRRLEAEIPDEVPKRPTGKPTRTERRTADDVPTQRIMHENVELRYSFHEVFNGLLATFKRFADVDYEEDRVSFKS